MDGAYPTLWIGIDAPEVMSIVSMVCSRLGESSKKALNFRSVMSSDVFMNGSQSNLGSVSSYPYMRIQHKREEMINSFYLDMLAPSSQRQTSYDSLRCV